MELVYLWIDKYKNINEEGFNFSPEFHCELKNKNILTIEKNLDCIPDFFAENLNVTALIGKNGSGKSSIFEVLSLLYWQGSIGKNDRSFLLYKKQNQFFLFCDNYKNLEDNQASLTEFISFENFTSVLSPTTFMPRGDFNVITFTNPISDITNNEQFKHLKTYADFYNGVQPKAETVLSNQENSNFNNKFLSLLNEKIDYFKFMDEKFIFNSYQFKIFLGELKYELNGTVFEFDKKDITESGKIHFTLEDKLDGRENILFKLIGLMVIRFTNSIIQNTPEDVFLFLNPIYDGWESFSSGEIDHQVAELFKKKMYSFDFLNNIIEICEVALTKINQNVTRLKKIFTTESVEQIINTFNLVTYTIENRWTIKEDTNPSNAILTSNIFSIKNDGLTLFNNNELMTYLYKENILKCDFFYNEDTSHNFLSLSSGEQLYLKFFTNYAYTLKNIQNDTDYILMMDEIELSLHPSWQQKIVKHLMYIHSLYKIGNHHLLITSHSPFILSDIPKRYVLFLTDGRQTDAFNKEETFGANIHTLLQDGFFMEDGLIGSFANKKITEIITFYKRLEDENEDKQKLIFEYEKKEKYFDYIMNCIGEEYLKNNVKNHLYEIEKILFGKDKAKENRIKELQTELQKLKEF